MNQEEINKAQQQLNQIRAEHDANGRDLDKAQKEIDKERAKLKKSN